MNTAHAQLDRLWEEHTRFEFVTCDTESTLETMAGDAYVNHIPVMTGGFGKKELRSFYSERFIPCTPPDTKRTLISRTAGEDQLVDEMIFSFTHTREMPWMLPGVPLTNRHVEVPFVAMSDSGRANWRMNTSTGIRLPCSSRSGSFRAAHCLFSAQRPPERLPILNLSGMPPARTESCLQVASIKRRYLLRWRGENPQETGYRRRAVT